MDKHYSPDNYLGVAIVHFEDLQLKRASLSVIFLLATATSVSTATQYGEMIFCTNIRAIYYTSLRSRRSEGTGARKNGTRGRHARAKGNDFHGPLERRIMQSSHDALRLVYY